MVDERCLPELPELIMLFSVSLDYKLENKSSPDNNRCVRLFFSLPGSDTINIPTYLYYFTRTDMLHISTTPKGLFRVNFLCSIALVIIDKMWHMFTLNMVLLFSFDAIASDALVSTVKRFL